MVELKEKQQNTMRVKDNIQFHFVAILFFFYSLNHIYERIRNPLRVAPRQHMRR